MLIKEHKVPNIDEDSVSIPSTQNMQLGAVSHKPRILLLYGSLRERSFSRLVIEESARLLNAFGAETRIYNPQGLPQPDTEDDTHPKVKELRELMIWSEGQVWCSPERHGSVTGIFKSQIDWVPLSMGGVRPTQGKTLAIMQVCGGSQSFNAVNQMRILGRWMRMVTIPNQSSVAKAFLEFNEDGRMKPSPYYNRIVDVMEELMKFTLLLRDNKDYFVDRYSERVETAAQVSQRVNQKSLYGIVMGLFERYLSVWVGLAIAVGIIAGSIMPEVFTIIATLEFAHVNIVVAVLIWLMIYPMMVQIDFSSIKDVGKKPKGLVLTLVINWLIKPFTMAFLGWLFFKVLFADWVDPETATEYIAGMILLGVAPCTAMVFVWSQMTKGDANYTLVQVSINDIIMIFAFAPIAGLLLGVTDITVPWDTLLLSVVLYVLVPLVAGALTRKKLDRAGDHSKIDTFLANMKPWSIIGLLTTVTLLFGFQADTILSKPEAIVLIAIPLLIQTYGIFALAYYMAKRMKLPHSVAAPACMIGTSNFFELAVAVAISLFGLHSGAALATVVGVLVEVPVMLSLVWFANRTRHWFG